MEGGGRGRQKSFVRVASPESESVPIITYIFQWLQGYCDII